MKFNYADIEMAFDFVGSGPPEEKYALIDKDKGKIYYASDLTDLDEIPKDIDWSSERYVSVPHRFDHQKSFIIKWCKTNNIQIKA
jgi:hypothetical protein